MTHATAPSGLRRAVRGTGLSILALLLTMAGVFGLAGTAHADEIDAITDVRITTEERPIEQWQVLEMEADFVIPADASAGDTFSLGIPPEAPGNFRLFAGTFDIKTPDGSATVGSCVIESQKITCTLNDYVENHSNIDGTMYFFTQAQASTDSGSTEFETGTGTEFDVEVGPDGIVEGEGLGIPDRPVKIGWVTMEGNQLRHFIVIPGDRLGADSTTVTDTYDPRTTLESYEVGYVNRNDWDNQNWQTQWTALPEDQYEATSDAANKRLTVEFGALADREANMYVISYWLNLPENVSQGDVFGNTVVSDSGWEDSTETTYYEASAVAQGDTFRQLRLAKAIQGPTDATEFEFEVACLNDGSAVTGYPKTVTVGTESPATVGALPVGTECTITETNNQGAAEVNFDPSNVVTIDEDSPQTITVTATNVFTTPADDPADDSPDHDSAHHDSAHHDSAHHDSAHHELRHHDSAHHDSAHHDSAHHDSAHHDSAHHDSAGDHTADEYPTVAGRVPIHAAERVGDAEQYAFGNPARPGDGVAEQPAARDDPTEAPAG